MYIQIQQDMLVEDGYSLCGSYRTKTSYSITAQRLLYLREPISDPNVSKRPSEKLRIAIPPKFLEFSFYFPAVYDVGVCSKHPSRVLQRRTC